MLKDAISSIERLYKQNTNMSCLITTVIVLAIDYLTGRTIRFPIVYVLPVSMAAWREQKLMAYATAIFMPLARVGFHFPWMALMLYAYLVDRIAWQTRGLEKKVRVLEGILPVCASCKRIRTARGEYEQIEDYITRHSEASFSHTICPECTKKLYPEYFKDGKGK